MKGTKGMKKGGMAKGKAKGTKYMAKGGAAKGKGKGTKYMAKGGSTKVKGKGKGTKDMAKGGDGGDLGFERNGETTCRGINYKNYPDSFFRKVCEGMGWLPVNESVRLEAYSADPI